MNTISFKKRRTRKKKFKPRIKINRVLSAVDSKPVEKFIFERQFRFLYQFKRWRGSNSLGEIPGGIRFTNLVPGIWLEQASAAKLNFIITKAQNCPLQSKSFFYDNFPGYWFISAAIFLKVSVLILPLRKFLLEFL